MSVTEQLAQLLIKNKLTISTAESCTGGLVSSKLTDVAGSSAYITHNVITYANSVKHNILGVSSLILEEKGAVSPECAEEMARGLYKLTGSDICLATTGIAGPDGGSPEKPVGLCYVGLYYKNNVKIKKLLFDSSLTRIHLKELFANAALEFVIENL